MAQASLEAPLWTITDVIACFLSSLSLPPILHQFYQLVNGHRQAGNLTEREVEVLCLLAQGYNTPQIAQTLDISRKTVEHHLAHIYAKLGVTCRTAAVVHAVQQGLV